MKEESGLKEKKNYAIFCKLIGISGNRHRKILGHGRFFSLLLPADLTSPPSSAAFCAPAVSFPAPLSLSISGFC